MLAYIVIRDKGTEYQCECLSCVTYVLWDVEELAFSYLWTFSEVESAGSESAETRFFFQICGRELLFLCLVTTKRE